MPDFPVPLCSQIDVSDWTARVEKCVCESVGVTVVVSFVAQSHPSIVHRLQSMLSVVDPTLSAVTQCELPNQSLWENWAAFRTKISGKVCIRR
jgi:hypothetical protein